MRRPLFSLCLLAFFQWSALSSGAQSLHFKHFSVEDGLASSIVFDAWQDSDDYIWFGTESGLSRFDGTEFKTFTTADGLPANTVLKVMEDAGGRLWLSCYNESAAYLKKGRFFSAKNDSTLAGMSFKSGYATFFRSEDLFFLFGLDVVYQAEGDKFPPVFSDELKPVKAISRAEGITYLLTVKGLFGGRDWQQIRQLDLGSSKQFAAFENNFFITEGNNLTMWQASGLKVTRDTLACSFRHPINKLRANQPGRVWLEVAQEGVFRLDYDRSGVRSLRHYPGIQNFNYVFTDQEGTTWFSTADNGVFASLDVENQVFATKDGLPSNHIFSLEKSPGGQLLAGDGEGNLLFLKKGKLEKSLAVRKTQQFNRLVAVRTHPATGNIWAATDEGVFAFDRQGRERFFRRDNIKSLCIGKNRVLVGHGTGVLFIDPLTFRTVSLPLKGRIMAIAEDRSGNLWVGKLDGLDIWRPSDTLSLGKKYPGLLNVRITGLAPGGKDTMWVATHQHGVVLLKNDTLLLNLTSSDGLTSDICQNIRLDEKGFVWVATNGGLSKINPRTFEISKFSTANYLPDNDVYDVAISGDTVWVATSKGIAVFRDKLPATASDFRTLLTELRVNGASRFALSGQPIVLPADSSDLELHFAALSTRSGGEFRYLFSTAKLRMPWHCRTWDDLGRALQEWVDDSIRLDMDTLLENRLRLSNVDPGRYLFQVTAISYDGVNSQEPDRLEILFKPRLLQRLWFQALCLALFACLGWRFYRWRLRLHERESRLTQEMTSLKLEAFKAQINPHFIFNTINGIQRFFFPPDPAKANEYIALFSNLLRKTLDFSEKTTVTFAQELEFLKEYLELTRLRVGEKFEYEITGEEVVPSGTEIPTLLLQPLVENAIVHGFPPNEKARLQLRFTLEGKRLLCSVEDNGTGIKASLARRQASGDQRTPKGTLLVRHRVEALNHLTNSNIRLQVRDKSDLGRAGTGTIAEVSFDLPIVEKKLNINL